MSDNIILYYDVNTNSIYDEAGGFYGNRTLTTYFNNKTTLEIHYVTETNATNPKEWTAWTGLSGLAIGSSFAFDNDYLHAVKGTINTSVLEGNEEVIVNVSIDKNNLNPSDKLVIYRADGTSATLLYDSYESVSTGYKFHLTTPTTEAFDKNLTVRVPQALYLKMTGDAVDNSQASIGVFKVNVHAMSHKILNALDYSSATGISGTLEHQIKNEGNTVRTFTFPLGIENLIDFDNDVNVPSQAGDWADKTYVLSFFNAGEITQYSSDGTEWHDTFMRGVDRFYRVKLNTVNGVWSDARPIAYGADGITPSIGVNGHWYLGDTDTGVVVAGSNAPRVMIQYSANGTSWETSYVQGTTKYIRFSVDGGSNWTSAMRYIGENAPMVQIQYSADGGAGNWHNVLESTDFFIRFSVDNGITWSGAMRIKAYNVKYQYGETASASFHDTFMPASDKYIKFSSDNGLTWSVAHKFIGDDGQSFVPNATGLYEGITTYDNEKQGFAYLVTSEVNEGKIYFKISDESGMWSEGLQFTPNGLSIQYSEDGASWHITSSVNDKFIRFSTDNGETWSSTLMFQGTSAYLYIAYAADNVGNGFSLKRSSDLDFWNIIQTEFSIPEEELTLTKFNEFGGGWTQVQGDDGITYEWLSGTTVPNNNNGKDGDWYLDVSAGNIYNKIAGSWNLKLNIIGKAGAGVSLKGVWTVSSTYSKDDMVTHEGNAYIAGRVNTGIEPGTSSEDWILYISKGEKGDPGEPLENNYVDVTSLEDGYIVVEDITVPVKVEINGVAYDIDDCPVIKEGGKFKMLADYFLAKANLASYSGIYRVWRAGGKKGEDGASSQLSIGTVVSGTTASASITGTAPNQVLNLVLPKGEKGEDGGADKLSLSGGTMQGSINMGGKSITSVQSIEIGGAGTNGGFIDFHYNNDSSDFTSRIIEQAEGQISISAPAGLVTNGNFLVRSVNGAYPADKNGNISITQLGCLPLAGGIMTGTVFTKTGETRPAIAYYDGELGGQIYLFDRDSSTYKGGFLLRSSNSAGVYTDLCGRSDGILTWAGKDITLGYPNYSAGVGLGSKSSYTTTGNGWIYISNDTTSSVYIFINSNYVALFGGRTSGATFAFLPVKKGDIIQTFSEANGTEALACTYKFYPNR